MRKELSNILDRMRCEKAFVNGGLKEMWNGYEKLVAKFETILLDDFRI